MKSRSSIGEKVFQPQEIPNLIEEYTIVDLEFKKLEKVEKRKEQRHREKLKNDRILTAKENKFLHSLDLIIHTGKTAKKSNFVTYADEGKTFTIPYFRFNFGDDLLERNSLNTFLDRLLKFGCFQTFERNPHSSTLQYVFSGVDLVQLGKARKIVEAETIDPLLLSKRLKRLLANTLIKDCLLKDTRAKLIKKLEDMQKHKMITLKGSVGVQSIESLKQMVSKVNEKLKKELWIIYGNRLSKGRSTYQLKRLTELLPKLASNLS
ncbi:MAG: hypothetical protein UT12_C0019G0008 [Candidatus Curtissbacteria bacterium GW2011_GWC2_38_9]|uniref:Uncharacterized protein n=3 Tax=Candidatus Curtissiibacteriota TaxID=1752717 RepID=A0A1F5HSN2_9BACT|nr:MAG: hypothetical protein UT12_C0019G0008 [Candidatus Curtissbacteria bacterium GW2011_GWC2_38_9]KKS03259.1 MAG: hypothetical protein UU56_C0021G0007 [Candidatus Curtissbacteria bacterium GW2011_GWA2_41_24]OGD90077.1 MAG: hypothetical protein A2Z54_02740 [Candidatus Curtissbacteria bacterium RIFCSPHIGHO2_02_39_8]OGE07221.1 MAG: hypothetical protein A2W70_02185 [Candidatus Curtissbacteria bacterium RIFCSPLOWO2_02_41_11]